jgi:hypothetical protein
MGSKTKSGVSPGRSRAMTGAATGPGSISGLSVKDAQNVVNRAMRIIDRDSPSGEATKDILTPRKVKIAAESLGIDRGGFPGPFLPPSEAIKNIRPDAVGLFIEMQRQLGLLKPDQPPSMSIPNTDPPNTPFPGFEPGLPDTTLPSATIPEEVPLPNYAQPGKVTLPELSKEVEDAIRGRSPLEGIGQGLQGIIIRELLKQQGLLDE